MMLAHFLFALAATLVAAPSALAASYEPVPDDAPAPRAIAERVEDVFRGTTARFEATMTVTSPRLPVPRRVRFRSWDDRESGRSFIRILAPAKDKGMGFLKLPPNLWNYIPRVEKTMRIPPSLMLQSWMGSDFTNDDLVRESSQLDDYDHVLLGVDPGGDGRGRAWVLEYRPHDDAPVVWGRIVTWIEVERFAPLRQDFYDESGERLREMRFDEIREVGGRPYPHRWQMEPLDKEGHLTQIDVHDIQFDEAIPSRIFTKRNLEKVD